MEHNVKLRILDAPRAVLAGVCGAKNLSLEPSVILG
jgi:hypothetical protein